MSGERHETVEGLRRMFAGEAAVSEVRRSAAHLTNCRECWLLAARALALQKAQGVVVPHGPVQSVIDLQETEQARLAERLDAQALWMELRSLTPKAQREKVRLSRRLHTPAFLDVLLEEGALASPKESEEIFYLALLVSGLPSSQIPTELKNDLCAECCAELANARRRLAKWPAARDALKKAHGTPGRALVAAVSRRRSCAWKERSKTISAMWKRPSGCCARRQDSLKPRRSRFSEAGLMYHSPMS